MLLSAKPWLLGASLLLVGAGGTLWFVPDEFGDPRIAGLLAFVGLAGIIGASLIRPEPQFRETSDIRELSNDRRRELMRGTSMFLRDSRYRYSIRLDGSDSSRRREFNAEVNKVRLGFIPAIISDTTTDREGPGYVAFVYDGRRWRGPGLPCPADQTEAVKHAAKCVSPLASDEETRCE